MNSLDQQQPELARHGIDSYWLDRGPTAHNLLLIYAHPDDESFGNAGTIAHYSAAGAHVHYVCATDGECGTVVPELLNGYNDIAELRRAELFCAAKTLGLASVHLLGYRDSGMRGAPDNQHPQAFTQAPFEQIVRQLVAVIRVIQPHVVVTFNKYGGYGHPDHIMAHRATVAAVHVAGASHYVDGHAAWEPRKLYYSTFSTHWLKLVSTGLQVIGKDPRRIGTNADVNLVEAAAQAGAITTSIDTRAYEEQKIRAWQCHQSQVSEMSLLIKLPNVIRKRLIRTEHFTRVIPPWPSNQPCETDLFAGLPL